MKISGQRVCFTGADWRPCLLALASLLVAAPAAAEPSWSFVVHLKSPDAPLVIDWTLNGFSGDLQVCSDKEGGGEFVHELRAIDKRSVEPDEDDSDCWNTTAAPGKPLQLSYRFDLKGRASGWGDPDTAVSVDGGFIFSDEAVLLRPDPLPPHARITVSFELPPGWDVAAPWTRLAPQRFETTSEQFDTGSYVAIGKLQSLGEVPVKGGAFDLTLMGTMNHVLPDVLRDWIHNAGSDVAEFYGGLPAPHVEILLAPVRGHGQGGVYGSTLREGHPSVVLFFCADAPASAFAGDWLPEHELFHLGNPVLVHRIPWFTEGAATYYQDVLRGRTHRRDAAVMWGDLYDGNRRFCQPEDDHSLQWESEHLGEEHHYQRLYWGAACLLWRTDVAIRQRSQDKLSLDDVMRDLLRQSHGKPLRENDLVRALDKAAGQPLARAILLATEPITLDGFYESLGIEPTGPDTVRLHDDAPLAAIRRAIFE